MDNLTTSQNSTKEICRHIWNRLEGFLNERDRRLLSGSMAEALGRGGLTCIHNITGLSIDSIIKGKKQIAGLEKISDLSIRRKGSGRPKASDNDPLLWLDLEMLFHQDPTNQGYFSWTEYSVAVLSEMLKEKGHSVVNRQMVFDYLSLSDYVFKSKFLSSSAQHVDILFKIGDQIADYAANKSPIMVVYVSPVNKYPKSLFSIYSNMLHMAIDQINTSDAPQDILVILCNMESSMKAFNLVTNTLSKQIGKNVTLSFLPNCTHKFSNLTNLCEFTFFHNEPINIKFNLLQTSSD